MQYWVAFLPLLLFLFLFLPQRKKRRIAVAHHILKRKKETTAMETLAKQFAGKECLIDTITESGSVQGTIREVCGGGLLVETAQGQLQAVNLEYVIRIREFPRNKKGKKKSVVLD